MTRRSTLRLPSTTNWAVPEVSTLRSIRTSLMRSFCLQAATLLFLRLSVSLCCFLCRSFECLTLTSAGYPIVTVPLGFFPNGTAVESAGPNTVWPVPGGPFGLSFLGTAFSEYDLVGFAYAYEQATHTRLERRAYPAAIPLTQLSDVVGK
jgi:hypothetical protein